MLKNNVKKVVICLIMVALLGLAFKVNIARGNDIFNQLPVNNNVQNISEGNREVPQNIEPVNNTANENVQNTPTNVTNKSNENAPKTTPYTGIGDSSSIIFIAIFIVSAVYAFIKVKKYEF